MGTRMVMLALLAGGCLPTGPILVDPEPARPSTDTHDPGLDRTDSHTGLGSEDRACVTHDAARVASQVVEGDTSSLANLRRPSCRDGGGADGPEAMIAFTAPSPGVWQFDLVDQPDNEFDTVLAVLTGCSGVELACNDDLGGSRQSQITLPLEEGQFVVVQLDGFLDTDAGPFSLSIEAL